MTQHDLEMLKGMYPAALTVMKRSHSLSAEFVAQQIKTMLIENNEANFVESIIVDDLGMIIHSQEP